jgi:hypothetical protein
MELVTTIKTLEELVAFAKKNNIASLSYGGASFVFAPPQPPTPEDFKDPKVQDLLGGMPSDDDMLLWSTQEQLSFEKPKEPEGIRADGLS